MDLRFDHIGDLSRATEWKVTNQKEEINANIVGILYEIDEKIKNSKERILIYDLPFTFSIGHMANIDAQRIIYYHVMRSLEDREFTVHISMNHGNTSLYIKWISKEEEQDIIIQNKYIAEHQLDKKVLPAKSETVAITNTAK